MVCRSSPSTGGRLWRAGGATMAGEDTRVVREVLGLAAGSAGLDVPCGDGRLTVVLATGGH